MRLTVDMQNARSFEPAEPGHYGFTVTAIAPPEKGPKATTVEVEFTFDDKAMDQACGTILRKFPIDGRGAGFFREFWKAATGEDLPIGQVIDVDTDHAIGRKVIGLVSNREYNGKLYNDIGTIVAAQ